MEFLRTPFRIGSLWTGAWSVAAVLCVAAPAAANDFYSDNGCEQKLKDVWTWVENEYHLTSDDFDRIAAAEGVPPNLLKAIVLAEQADYNTYDYFGDGLGLMGDMSRSIGIGQLQGDRVNQHHLWAPSWEQRDRIRRNLDAGGFGLESLVEHERNQLVVSALLDPPTGLRIAAREIKYILDLLRAAPTSPYVRSFFRSGRFPDENPYADARLDVWQPAGVSPADVGEMVVAKAVAAPYNTPVPAGERSLIDVWNIDSLGHPAHVYRSKQELKLPDGNRHPYRNALVQSQNALVMAGCLTMQDIEGTWRHESGFAIHFQGKGDQYIGYLAQPTVAQKRAGYQSSEQVASVRRTGGRTFAGTRKHRSAGVEDASWGEVSFRIQRSSDPGSDLMVDQNGERFWRRK